MVICKIKIKLTITEFLLKILPMRKHAQIQILKICFKIITTFIHITEILQQLRCIVQKNIYINIIIPTFQHLTCTINQLNNQNGKLKPCS